MINLISYYGLKVQYRIEYRTKELHPTAVFRLAKLSMRHDEASKQEIIIRVPKGKNAADPGAINALVPLFLKRLDAKLQGGGTNIRLIRELPLAALWVIDQDGTCEQNKWSSESYKEYASSFDKLISLWGDHDLSKLTPKYCNGKLLNMSSSHRIKSMIRALRLLYRFESAFGHKVHAEWENYQYTIGRSTLSPAALRKKYVDTTSLSNAQLRKLFQTCYDNLSNKDGYLYFGLLLKASLLLSDSELCALQFSSFSSLTDYVDRSIVRITHEYTRQSGNKNYRRVQLVDTYRIRALPLPGLVRKAYRKLISSGGPSDDDSPLLRHANNADRYLSPEVFASWVWKTMQSIFPEHIDCGTAAKADTILDNTALQNLTFSGLEKDEINYYRGVCPTSVASQYYCDFGNESILNKMGALEDRWLDSIITLSPASPSRGSITYNYRSRKMMFQPALGHRCSLLVTIQCPCVAFGLYGGPRPSEIRAIRWDDIHPIDGHKGYFFTLCKTLDPQGTPKDTMKTDNAYRTIPIHSELLDILKRRWEFIQHAASAAHPTYICCYKNNFTQPCTQAQLSIFAKKILASIVDEDTLQMNAIEAALDDIRKPQSESSQESLTMYVLRRNFWTWMQGRTELDTLEKRYLMGHEVLGDGDNVRGTYNNPEALWRMAQKMDQFGINPDLHTKNVTIELNGENPSGGKTDAGIVNISVPSEGGTLVIQATSLDPSDPIQVSMRRHPTAITQVNGEYILTNMPAPISPRTSINQETANWKSFQTAKKRHRETADGAKHTKSGK